MQGIHVVGKHWKFFSAKNMNILASIVRKKCTNSSPSPFCGYFKKPPFSPLCKGGENSRLKSRDRSEAGGGNKRAPPNHPFSRKNLFFSPLKAFFTEKFIFSCTGKGKRPRTTAHFYPFLTAPPTRISGKVSTHFHPLFDRCSNNRSLPFIPCVCMLGVCPSFDLTRAGVSNWPASNVTRALTQCSPLFCPSARFAAAKLDTRDKQQAFPYFPRSSRFCDSTAFFNPARI